MTDNNNPKIIKPSIKCEKCGKESKNKWCPFHIEIHDSIFNCTCCSDCEKKCYAKTLNH